MIATSRTHHVAGNSETALQTYCTAFVAQDASTIADLFAPNGLYDIPFLKRRLVGHAEIAAGLEAMFAVIEGCSWDLIQVRSNGSAAIGEGHPTACLNCNGETVDTTFGIIAEAVDGKLSKLCVYLDARPYRLWIDGPIFALSA